MMTKQIKGILIMEQIGQGQFSQVHRGVYANNEQKQVAVKIMKKTNMNMALINQEIDILRGIKHPNIINFLDQINTKNNTYIITELCIKGNFRQFLRKNYMYLKVPENHAKKYFIQIANGVKALHEKKIVHRDLKLDNIFINKNYQLKIGDFGFAKSTIDENLLQSFKGTPVNMAPEILKTKKNLINHYDQKCDIWSLGTILYEMLFGTIIGNNVRNFNDVQQLLMSDDELKFPKDQNISKDCYNLLQNLLKKDPSKRYDIKQVLEHKWLQKDELFQQQTSQIIKSFYYPQQSQQKQIVLSKKNFINDNLVCFICFDFKNKLQELLQSIVKNIKDQIQQIQKAIQLLQDNISQDLFQVYQETVNFLHCKVIQIIEKLISIQITFDNNHVIEYAQKVIDTQMNELDLQKQYNKSKQYLQGLIDFTTNIQNEEITPNLLNCIFEIAMKNLQLDYCLKDCQDLKEEKNRIHNIQKSIVLMLDIVQFESVQITCQIEFQVQIGKDLNFDHLNIETYLENFDLVEEDDFDEQSYTKFMSYYNLELNLETRQNYPNKEISEALTLLKKLLTEKLSNNQLNIQ